MKLVISQQLGASSLNNKLQKQFHHAENDPNLKFQCLGTLGEYPACLCNDESDLVSEVVCINAQFVDTAALMYVNGFYDSARSITFHGNNFQELPDSPLFGSTPHPHLKVLNLSANYIVNLGSGALKGLSNIEILDLSYNEIVLSEENINFLSHVPSLTYLYLRRAFASPATNRGFQLNLMMRLLENARLNHLTLLDLSYNFLHSVPYNLPCHFPSLSTLDLRQNLLKSISMNMTCLRKIGTVDLSKNYLHELNQTFRSEFADQLPYESLLIRNMFYCNCHSIDWIRWIRSTKSIREKALLTCSKASPPSFTGARIIEIPETQLDCKTDLYTNNHGNFLKVIFSRLIYFFAWTGTLYLFPFVDNIYFSNL